MPVPQNQQITLEMILSAQDRASEAIKKVGAELAHVGKDVDVGDLSAGVRQSLEQVTAQIRAAGGERDRLARTQAQSDLTTLRTGLSDSLATIKDNLDKESRARLEQASKDQQTQRDAAATSLRNQRSIRDENLRTTRAYFDQEGQVVRAALARDTEVYREAEREQIASLRETMKARIAAGEKPVVVRAETALSIRNVRRDRYSSVADLRRDSQEELAVLKARADRDLDITRGNYLDETAIIATGLRTQLDKIKGSAADEVRILQENAGKAIAAKRTEIDGLERLRTGDLHKALDTGKQATSELLAQQRSYADAVIGEAKRMAKEQEDAAKAAVAAQKAAAREAVSAQNAVARAAREAAKAAEASVGPLERVAEKSKSALEGFGNFGKQLVIWNLGYAAIGKISQGIGELSTSLVTVNANLEQYTATFSSIYQNKDKGKEAVAWLTDFAVKVPATREQVVEAGLAIASLGDNVAEVMKPLSNVSAVMGVDLPRAAQAFADAQEGRFEMLKTTLHVSKEELVQFGLQLNSSGQVLNNSFVPAFEKLGNVRFGKAADEQMHTLYGQLSNVKDAFTNLEQIAGHGVFKVLEGQLGGLIKTLGSANVERWAMGIGQALGHALQGAITFTQWMVHNFGPPVLAVLNAMVALWQAAAPLIAGAAHVVQEAIAGIAAVLQQSVLPFVQNGLGQMKGWWDAHAKNVGVIWDNVGAAIKKFWDWLSKTAHNVMLELQGYWTIVWGVLSGVVGIAIDVMSGDWKRAKTDFVNIWKSIEVGVLEIVNGLVDQVIHAFVLMAGPIMQALNAVFKPAFQAVVSLGVELFMFLALKVEQVFAKIAGNVHGVVKTMTVAMSPLLGLLPGGNLVADSLNKTVDRLQGGKDDSMATLITKARAAGIGAATDVGAVLGTGPLPSLSISERQEKAITHTVDTFFSGLEKNIDKTITSGATAGGKQWWTKIESYMNTHGIVLPKLPPTTAVGTPDLSLPGYSTTTAGEQAKAVKQEVRDAQDRFQLLLDSGKATWSAGIADINAILKDEKGTASPVQMQLDALRDTKELVTNLLDTARKQFDFDTNVAHPSRAQMQKDEAQVLAILAKTPGIQPLDIKSAKQQMDKTIADAMKNTGQSAQDALAKAQKDLGYEETLKKPYAVLKAQVDLIMKDLAATGVKPGSLQYQATYKQLIDEIGKQTGTTGTGGVSVPTPLYGPYRITTPQYGATQASFGGAAQQNSMAALVSHLQSLVTYWSARARRDEDALRAQQQTAAHTLAVAQNTQSLPERLAKAAAGLGLSPEPSNAGAASRARGGFAPMRRN